jgi:O-antigen/teichoic acid export membrane protein
MLTQVDSAVTTAPAARVGGLRRVAGITASLVGTQAFTSVLGLVFWTLAARRFSVADVGVAGAAVAMMMLLGSFGSLGLGTLLIARLPLIHPGSRRVLIRTCLATAAVTAAVLAATVPLVAGYGFGAQNLLPLVDTPLAVAGLALGTGLFSATLVLDQAALTVGVGSLQLERNVMASAVKILALLVFGYAGIGGGMAIFLAWTIGSAVSLPLVSWRSRGGWIGQEDRRIVAPRMLAGIGRAAASHHALNITVQAALQILPILVTVMLSAQDNAYFNSAVLVSGFVFALPYAISIGLFAAAGGDEREVLTRMNMTIPVALGASIAANIVLIPFAGVVLGLFGSAYADQGADVLRALVLAGVPFVIKDHFIALRRVQGRTTQAVLVLAGFLIVELGAAAFGASVAGTVGLCLAWVAVLFVEAAILAVPLYRGWRRCRRSVIADPITDGPALADPPLPEVAGSMVVTAQTNPAALASGTEVAALTADVASARRAGRGHRWPSSATRGQPRVPRHAQPKPSRSAALRDGRIRRTHLAGPTLVAMSVGILMMSVAAADARASSPSGWSEALWVGGLVLIFAPAAFRVALSSTGHGERMILAVALPVALQVSRLVLFPTRFAFHDELIHATTLRQIDITAHLFSSNPLLPVSGFYPGMEVVTDAVHAVTELPLFASAVIVLLLARIVMALSILALVALLTGSRRAGAVAVVVYACNSQFLFFNSQYSYQTLALPLAIFTVYVFATRDRRSRRSMLLPLSVLGMITFTHHVTAILLVAAFAVWLVLELTLGRRGAMGTPTRGPGARTQVGGLIVMVVVGSVLWLAASVVPGNPIGGYLAAIVTSSSSDVSSLSQGQQTKAIFADTAGTGPAPWEQALIIGAVLITMLSLIAAVLFARDRLRRRDALGVVIALLALLYPVVPGGHLTRATAEVGDRAAGFVFVGLAAAIGWWFIGRVVRWHLALAFTLAASVIFLGDVVLGSGPTAGQLPGPYLISADARSVDADNIAAADWLATGIPAGSNVYADRVSGLLAAADGGQTTVRHVSTGIDASRLLLDPEYTPDDLDLIRRAQLDFLIVDTRLSNGLPHQQVYIETGEFGGDGRTVPVPAAALNKFSSVPGVRRIYDNGSLVIYDLRGLRDGG